MSSQRPDGYDEGGILPGGVRIDPSTMQSVTWFSPAQIAAYERAVELVKRWSERDAQST